MIQKQHHCREARSFCHSARKEAYQSVLLFLIKSFTATDTINRSLQLSNRHILIWLEFRSPHLDSHFLDLKYRKKFPKRNFLNAIEVLLQLDQLLNRHPVHHHTSVGEMVQLQQVLPTCKCRKTPTVEACCAQSATWVERPWVLGAEDHIDQTGSYLQQLRWGPKTAQ